MMIGKFTPASGGYIGSIQSLGLDLAEVTISPVLAKQGADSDDAGRAFRLMSATCSDRSRPAVPIDVSRGGGSPTGRT